MNEDITSLMEVLIFTCSYLPPLGSEFFVRSTSVPSLWKTLAYMSSSRPLAELRPEIRSFFPSLPGWALGSFLFGSIEGQLRSTEVTFCRTLKNHYSPSQLQHVKRSETQHPPGDVEVVEQLSLGEALLQEPVGLLGSHLGDGAAASFSRRHIGPLHQTAYASHAETGGEGRGWEGVTEVFVGATGQRKSLDWSCHWLQGSVGGWGDL